MNFLINTETVANNNSIKTLEGNAIHKVTFKGCESTSFEGKDGRTYKVLKIKFENENGIFEDVIYEPTEADFKRAESSQGYKNPSNYEYLITKIRHLIATVRPDLDKDIEEGKKSISAANWDSFRDLIVRATNKGKDVETEIKLFKNKSGYAVFPRFFLGMTKDEHVYMKKGNNFIGTGLYFTEKEKIAIENQQNAKPTDMNQESKKEPIASTVGSEDFDDIDL